MAFCSTASSKLYYNPEIVASASINQQQFFISQQDTHQIQTEYGIAQLYKQHLKRQQRSQPTTSQAKATQSSMNLFHQPSDIITTSELVHNTGDHMLVTYISKDYSVRYK